MSFVKTKQYLMQKYSRIQEKKNYATAVAETYDFLFEAKRDERQACTEYQVTRREREQGKYGNEDDLFFWFSYWEDAMCVLYGNKKEIGFHSCHCHEGVDAHLDTLFGRQYRKYILSF